LVLEGTFIVPFAIVRNRQDSSLVIASDQRERGNLNLYAVITSVARQSQHIINYEIVQPVPSKARNLFRPRNDNFFLGDCFAAPPLTMS